MNYWLMKTEPSTYSIDDLKKDKITSWEGVRNYQARNYMMHDMQVDDLVLVYHSNTDEIGVVGIGKVATKAYPDKTQFDPQSDYYDPKSTKENPRWWCVDIGFVEKFPKILTLNKIKSCPELSNMVVAQKGSRLSITPVEKKHFEGIQKRC
ncbi:MAG TPA: EVE domain-containing protein [Candidatus Paceibacterota bacterium]